MIEVADAGLGDNRCVNGCSGFMSSRHFLVVSIVGESDVQRSNYLVKLRLLTAKRIRLLLDLNHGASGRNTDSNDRT